MDFSLFLQQLINGLSVGSMYALIAVGYTMVYGVLRLINFAHGDIMMVGAYICLICMASFEIPFLVALCLAIVFAMCIGIATDKIAYKPLRKAPKISLLITAIGISFLLQSLFNMIFTSTPRFFTAPEYFEKNIEFIGLSISFGNLLVPILTFFIMLIVLFILYKSKYGIAIRALAFDVQTVNLMGIDANRIIAIVFAIGSALACVGGIFYAAIYYSVTPTMGTLVGLKAFAAAVLGGIGSVVGAVIGGLIIGLSEVIAIAFFPELSGFKDAFAFIFLVFILLFKPSGILGINFERSRF
ncbi:MULTISPECIES: branched-chain amino acid ABC transporter permease [unclassified Campylobacter]|uniref:branched-chain amino acid ABC transporter permease n=1 Tax=unclassified Campylobacter TaxID=2593542 RepID=UPI001237ED0B|nr:MULTISPECIES: branched-chain amino acid ABC transporter permease [unclassified Campylobacter]KAA6225394.1 branched-chain amino acid ABC transporter permease [Campylobacter sp. LR185c]KAA6227090.1 branched-chain amino acid ABC transporter permease [Campylobacter sp. LR196d]KAA6228716.1 branched-chain amino acid ABC transporter permease [Campylobacter sp. LR286c]KAA6229526.1 branched-chain amino acid ABC transporter permease [Campylobacter sp. LR264d]KAA6230770.1 branched-chain amino acid ABC